MPAGDFELIFAALEDARVRYLVVGGVAVVLHGHLRFTADLDLVLSMERANVLSAVTALQTLGYRPRAPVTAEHLADPAIREGWVREKDLTVLSFWSDAHPATSVDLFVTEPFSFSEAYERAARADIGGLKITVASIQDLIDLKKRVSRPQDLEDIRALEELRREEDDDG